MAKQPTATEQPFKDYYEILHLHAEADAAMVDQAYWHLARLYNAAIPTDSRAREKLDDLNEAYSVLRSAELRAAYDEARNELLRQGLLTVAGDSEEEPDRGGPPLAVMSKQRPKPRKQAASSGEASAGEAKTPVRLQLQRLFIPPWQSALSALVIFVLAAAALVAGTPLLLVMALVIVGLACSLIPVVRGFPRLPTLPSPTLHLPAVRAPRLPERHSEPPMDADALRRSTAAMRQRWRVEPEASPLAFPKHSPWPDSTAELEADGDTDPQS